MSAAGLSLRAALTEAAAIPFQYDTMTEQVMMVALKADAINKAAFLDQRVLAEAGGSFLVPTRDFADAASSLPARLPNMIFHQGHCGSTLISRLIAAASPSRAFREPLVLRSLAALAANAASGDAAVTPNTTAERVALFLRCFAQGRSPSIVKASSICTDLAAPLMAENPDFRALFVFVQPDTYIATMLAGPNNRVDLGAFGGLRRQRLRNRGVETAPLFTLSTGQLAALAWLCEAAAYHAAPKDGRFLAVDFDGFLSDPLTGLQAASRHLGLAVDPVAARMAIDGPDMRTYSKAQHHEFTPALRAQILSDARHEFSREIDAGMDWLDEIAGIGDGYARQAIDALRNAAAP